MQKDAAGFPRLHRALDKHNKKAVSAFITTILASSLSDKAKVELLRVINAIVPYKVKIFYISILQPNAYQYSCLAVSCVPQRVV